MKNIRRILILALVGITMPLSCSKKAEDIVDSKTPPSGGFETVDVQVKIPDGVNLDLTTTEVFSVLEDYTVLADSSSSANYIKGERSLAFLRDPNGASLLMGFITDTKRKLSTASTAEVALFFGLGTVFLPNEVKEKYLSDVSTLPGFARFVAQVYSLFRLDNNFLGGVAFSTLLQAYVAELTQTGDIVGATANRLDFTLDVRSGVGLEEQDGDVMVLVNKSRRRAHAYFYKTSSTDTNDVQTTLISDIAGTNAASKNNVIVSPATGVSSFIGAIQNWASGKGMEVVKKESNPTTLKLLDSEKKALYKIRVIGPARTTTGKLTSQEKARLKELNIETLGLDFALPILMNIVGGEGFLKDLKASKWDRFFAAFKVTLASLPAVNDALTEGDLEKASREFLGAFTGGAASDIFEDLLKALLDNISGFVEGFDGGFTQENSQKIIGRTKSFFDAMQVVDKILATYDFSRIYSDYYIANSLEEWEVTVTRNKVSLNPKETWVIQGEEKTFKAVVQNGTLPGGAAFEYRWSTSGAYGELRAPNKTGVSFTSSSAEVAYFSSNVVDLPDNAQETITVEVYIKQGITSTRVDSASAKLEVRPLGFMITPDSASISGGDQLKLYVKRTDETNPLMNSFFDYRFVWYTPASYGLFNGAQSDIAVVNDNTILYEALDKETEQGIEDIEVSIYARPKGTTERYGFVDRVSSKIQIENDSLKRSFFLDFVTVGKPPHLAGPNNIFCEYTVQNAVTFPPFDPPPGLAIVNYKLTITEGRPAFIGTGRTWLPENAQSEIEDSVQIHFAGPEKEDSTVLRGVYVYRFGGTGGQGGAPCGEAAFTRYPEVISIYNNKFKGKAQVVITLKHE